MIVDITDSKIDLSAIRVPVVAIEVDLPKKQFIICMRL